MQVCDQAHEISCMRQEMLRIRMIEEAIADRYPQQKMRCPVHLSIGQEAIAVGVCAHLKKSDYAVSNHRAHAHYLAKGGNFKKMLAEIYGKQTGCSLGRGGSMHLVDLSVGFLGSTPIVGGSIPVGVGAAFGALMKNEDKISAVFFGEGSTEEGVFAESINFACLKKLPVLFICENNFYSVYSPLSVRQPPERSITSIAQAHGMRAIKGDGNNLEEVSAIARESIQYVREGHGPCLLEFCTYRFREHCGPHVDPYQPSSEVSQWKDRDPLIGVEEGRLEIQKEIEEAFFYAENSPYPSMEQEGESLYA